ncbi:hypothetical protein E1287_37630 [Actinomadura sp. KC06]|uniref:phage tail tube protein n=1 Tax=Actinomadura sp. KC06 TaxID=2530369 RepID=UPI0010430F95|nr:hypothetical protein [Actinomadura sp. KC06]TDD25055.1 hypothetical protein E1287_37630 [Actinomadura sp. KC06]
MTLRKINARDIIIEVETAVTDTWAGIRPGLTSATINPGENEEVADTTTYGSEGEYEQEVMQRGATMEVEAKMLKDDVTGVLDTGQARVEVLATKKGVESLGRIRFRHPMDTEWRIWTCTATLGEQGGETNDKTSWGATFTKSGPSSTAAVV